MKKLSEIFNFKIIAIIGGALSALNILAHFTFNFFGWDFSFDLAYVFLLGGGLISTGLLLAVGMIWLRKVQGYSNFMQVFSHCILIGLLAAIPHIFYLYNFNQRNPDYDARQWELREQKFTLAANQTGLEKHLKDKYTELASQAKTYKEESKTIVITFNDVIKKELMAYLVPSMIFGLIFGFMFGKMLQ